MTRRSSYPFAAALVSTLLAACGGGGPEVSPYAFDLQEAWANQLIDTSVYQVSISGQISDPDFGVLKVTGSGTLTRGPNLPSVFETVAGLQKTSTLDAVLSATYNGQTITEPFTDNFTEYFSTAYVPGGRIDTSDCPYQVVTSWTPPPIDAMVGDAGQMFILQGYDSAGKTINCGSAVVSYSVAADTKNSVLFKLINVNPAYPDVQSIMTFRVTTTGVTTILSETLDIPGFYLKISYY